MAEVRSAPVGFVYFIRDGRSGPIKIGYAKDPERRLARLQTSSPKALYLLGAARAELEVERQLHAEFAADRVRGEWFRTSAALREVIREAAKAWVDELEARAARNLEELKAIAAARRSPTT